MEEIVAIIETKVDGEIVHIPISDRTFRKLYSMSQKNEETTEKIAEKIIKKIMKRGCRVTDEEIMRQLF